MTHDDSETERFFRNLNSLISFAFGAAMFYVAGVLMFGIFIALCLLFDPEDDVSPGSALGLIAFLGWLLYLVALDLTRSLGRRRENGRSPDA